MKVYNKIGLDMENRWEPMRERREKLILYVEADNTNRIIIDLSAGPPSLPSLNRAESSLLEDRHRLKVAYSPLPQSTKLSEGLAGTGSY